LLAAHRAEISQQSGYFSSKVGPLEHVIFHSLPQRAAVQTRVIAPFPHPSPPFLLPIRQPNLDPRCSSHGYREVVGIPTEAVFSGDEMA
jgi:hypothetical protein